MIRMVTTLTVTYVMQCSLITLTATQKIIPIGMKYADFDHPASTTKSIEEPVNVIQLNDNYDDDVTIKLDTCGIISIFKDNVLLTVINKTDDEIIISGINEHGKYMKCNMKRLSDVFRKPIIQRIVQKTFLAMHILTLSHSIYFLIGTKNNSW